jgi:uncharacterized damage-inducible protein DinB
MKLCAVVFAIAAFTLSAAPSKTAANFVDRWTKTRGMALRVAEIMPSNEYAFRPDPGSMSFAEQIIHVAQTNHAFCAGLKDQRPAPVSPTDSKDTLIQLLAESFDYCASTIATLTDADLDAVHSSPDGRMPGREVMLALYVHMAHHRGQMEVYLRIKGIAPPAYVF